jgi:hypothetical protein
LEVAPPSEPAVDAADGDADAAGVAAVDWLAALTDSLARTCPARVADW